MDAANLHRNTPAAGPGELVLQNGRHAGARRSLAVPATFIGRNANCDFRLNVDGVDPIHCLLMVVPGGVQLRDLGAIGTQVNGERADNVQLRDGDLLQVGPFEFRLELPPPTAMADEFPIEEQRAALRVQASAVAAQQAALEEEEAKLLQRRHDLTRQEEQLAALFAKKQHEVQVWSDFTSAEREAMRMQKIEQEKHLDKLEQEVQCARELVSNDHQKLGQERQRIIQVYQRLRQRWQKHWSAEREKYQRIAKTLQSDTFALDGRDKALLAKEAALREDILQFTTQRELATRQIHDSRAELKHDQARWRRRRSHEFAVLKGTQRKIEQAQIKLRQARQLLVDEKTAWDRQLVALQTELHGLNNRVVHQRCRVQEQTEEIARLDALLRDRRAASVGSEAVAAEIPESGTGEAIPECEVVVIVDDTASNGAPGEARLERLDIMAGELSDQRLHLIEQYQCLAEIQDDWQRRRDLVAAELEALAERLLSEEQSLDQREQQATAVESILQQRQEAIETVRQEIQIWRAQLKANEQACGEEHDRRMLAFRRHEAQLQDQLAALDELRQKWIERRQEESEHLRVKRDACEEEKKETQRRRVELYERTQHVEEEKRILSEHTLALEQYRQEVFFRAQDPAARRRVERLRRRWLSMNSTFIRSARAEREAIRKELQGLESLRADLAEAMSRYEVTESLAAEQAALLEQREAVLKARELHVEQLQADLERQRIDPAEQHLRLENEADLLAKAVYDDPDSPPIGKAA